MKTFSINQTSAAASEMRAKIEAIRTELATNKNYTRSAWNRGVNFYASELLDNLLEAIDYAEENGTAMPEFTQADMMNGAASWTQYSNGGCSLVSNCDIAENLCSASELKRYNGGSREPNARESWLDVQARALKQAAMRIINAEQMCNR